MEVREGYKQTEVGVIPEDWEVIDCGKIIRKIIDNRGKTPPLSADGFPLIEANSIRERSKSPDFSKVTKYVNQYTYDNWFRDGHPKVGDVLLVTVGSAGASAYVQVRMGCIAQNIIGIRLNAKSLGQYFYYYTCSNLFKKQVTAVLMGAVQPSLKAPHIKSFVFPLPPTKAEQTAIATALSDADELITALDTLIAKKRNIKQGAMQELLTGKKRLPGFSGKWIREHLGNVCQIATGKKDVNQGNPNGEFPFFTCSRDHTFSDSYSFEGESILIAGNGEVGNLHYYNGKFEAYQRTYVLQSFRINPMYVWHQLDAFLKVSLGIGTVGSSIPYIKKENLTGFEFPIPMDPDEQTAIAQVLSDMDTEIEELERKRDKYKAVKQGMMQELLTGKTRLI